MFTGDWHGKRVLVIGAGKSGLAASRYLAAKGAKVVLADKKKAPAFEEPPALLLPPEVELFLGGYPPVEEGGFDLVVLSPGVPLSLTVVERARTLGIPVTGELELAFRQARAPVVAITGTNGKTTTTALTGQIFQEAGIKTLVAGNIGRPLIAEVEDYGPQDAIVLEVSSFQLETADTFHPRVAAVLNITPDHLDRHGTMEAYVAAKARIFARQTADEVTVLNYDDPLTRSLASSCPGRVVFFSRREELAQGAFLQNGWITVKEGGKAHPLLPAGELPIPGLHNLENALAAVACAWWWGIEGEKIAGALRRFPGVPHRLEPVVEINGVTYVNDSKGTNPEASIKALEAFDRPIVLIAGGRNKGSDFTDFVRVVKKKARALVVLGECAPQLAEAARAAGVSEVYRAVDLREAVLTAHRLARSGDVVLLSPACASWDMFKNYEERGECFKKIVRELAGA